MEIHQLRGKNGYTIGSPKYWHHLNLIGLLQYIRINEFIKYHETLASLLLPISAVVTTVYNDLVDNILVIQFVPKSLRDNLMSTLIGMSEICAIISPLPNQIILQDCINILKLTSNANTPLAVYSKSDIDHSVVLIRTSTHGLSVAKKKELLNKIIDKGPAAAINGNIKNLAFVKELADGKTIGYLEALRAKIQYVESNAKYRGRNGYSICSDEYTYAIVQTVFPLMIEGALRSGAGERLLNSLGGVYKTLAGDLSRLSSNDLEVGLDKNYEVYTALKQLSMCGVTVSGQLLELMNKRQKTKDVTKALYELMSEIKFSHSTSEFSDAPMETLVAFKSEVEDGAKYDLKVQDAWQGREFVFNGKFVAGDAPGNILYGFHGKCRGIPEQLLLMAPGLIQIKNGTSDSLFASTFFDEPRDQSMIKLGFYYYEKFY